MPILLLALLVQAAAGAVTRITAKEFHKGKKCGFFDLILDVRTEAEWLAGHVNGATFVDSLATRDDIPAELMDCSRCRIVVYCRSGARAGVAAARLEAAGFTDVYNGLGTTQWKARGYNLVQTGLEDVDANCSEKVCNAGSRRLKVGCPVTPKQLKKLVKKSDEAGAELLNYIPIENTSDEEFCGTLVDFRSKLKELIGAGDITDMKLAKRMNKKAKLLLRQKECGQGITTSQQGMPPRDLGDSSVCLPATSSISPRTHAQPVEGSVVSRIAFGSCFRPDKQNSPVLWRHLREEFQADLWVWLGDNQYSRGTDMNDKRVAYNEVRDDEYYSTYGPIAEPKIPVTGSWDDNDFGDRNVGKYYPCHASSQAEFAIHFGIPESDPRHPAQAENQRSGVYSSRMFSKPGSGGENGIHVINLDARSHRSPTFEKHGACEGAESKMIGQEQWDWLEGEMLGRSSVVKVVSSGVQVLPPTSRAREATKYCSYDGPGRTFDAANLDVGEGPEWDATTYESWAEIPQDRTRLLRLAQQSINTGMTERVIFLSGEQHWGEIMAKRVPSGGANHQGDPQVLYEVTASGIDQNWVEDVVNPTRVRLRSADKRGDGIYHNECNFPFIVNGVKYNDCADVFGAGAPGCSIETTSDHRHVDGKWGNCLAPEEELVPRERSKFSRDNKCSDNYHHTCLARANYGGLEMDWEDGTITLSIFTPHESEALASSVTIDLGIGASTGRKTARTDTYEHQKKVRKGNT